MKITFNSLGTQEAEKQYTDKREVAKVEKGNHSYGVSFLVGKSDKWAPTAAFGKEKGKSLIELQQEVGNANVAVQQDYMTLMSHTMSEEDYAKLSKDGFHFENMDPEAAVTIVDKIKAELVRSGQHIAGYTDDLDMDTLAAALGSDALARTVSHEFAQADIPATQENIDGVARAWDMASQLETPGEGARHYMLDNGLEPEIWNLYLAQSSGAQSVAGNAPRYYAEEIQGYYTQSAQTEQPTGLQQQMDRVISEAGFEINEETRQQAEWLVQKNLPLTAENLERLNELQEIAFPVEPETFARAVAAAIAEGREPIHANLTKADNLYQRAALLADTYYDDMVAFLDAGDVTARRQLEEIRLRMTAEVNVKLLKSGFAIDTAPMEQLLEALKQAEQQLAQSYFPTDAQAVEKYQIYQQTTQVMAEIPQLPAQLLGSWSIREEQGSVAQFHAEGKALVQSYDKVQESYEALMTAPRADMGDSIRKAFANVDAILEDMGYELTGENQRAARILGYNRMPMTVENMERVKAVDAQVRQVIEKMTPAATLKMIRDGVNPLERSFEELQSYFDTMGQEYEESAESYSRFLYQLEQHKEITQQEREAYIGIYRLLRQIEKSDGAVIGAVVNSRMELQFANLLAAVRSNRFKHMDVKATDELGLTSELIRSSNNISDQINNNIASSQGMENRMLAMEAVAELSADEAVEQEYQRMNLEQVRHAAQVEADAVALLQRGELPAGAGRLLAAQALMHDEGAPYRKWKEKLEELSQSSSLTAEEIAQSEAALETHAQVWERLEDKTAFQEAYEEMLDTMRSEVEQASLAATTSLDVRELHSIHKQLSVATALTDSEEYILPMYIGDELSKVHLTLERGSLVKGAVSIQVDLSEQHVEAHFRLYNEKISGFLVGNTDAEVAKLKRTADIFLESLKNKKDAAWEMSELPIVNAKGAQHPMMEETASQQTAAAPGNVELYQIAKLFLQAIKG